MATTTQGWRWIFPRLWCIWRMLGAVLKTKGEKKYVDYWYFQSSWEKLSWQWKKNYWQSRIVFKKFWSSLLPKKFKLLIRKSMHLSLINYLLLQDIKDLISSITQSLCLDSSCPKITFWSKTFWLTAILCAIKMYCQIQHNWIRVCGDRIRNLNCTSWLSLTH